MWPTSSRAGIITHPNFLLLLMQLLHDKTGGSLLSLNVGVLYICFGVFLLIHDGTSGVFLMHVLSFSLWMKQFYHNALVSHNNGLHMFSKTRLIRVTVYLICLTLVMLYDVHIVRKHYANQGYLGYN